MVGADRHYTVSVFLVYKSKLLLIKNPHHGIWLPPGGHVEQGELLTDAALREVNEETGLSVELYSENELFYDLPKVRELVKPEGVLLINVKENHQHIDFIYFAKTSVDKINPLDGESKEFKWFSSQELIEANKNKEIQNDIFEFGLRAVRKFGGERK